MGLVFEQDRLRGFGRTIGQNLRQRQMEEILKEVHGYGVLLNDNDPPAELAKFCLIYTGNRGMVDAFMVETAYRIDVQETLRAPLTLALRTTFEPMADLAGLVGVLPVPPGPHLDPELCTMLARMAEGAQCARVVNILHGAGNALLREMQDIEALVEDEPKASPFLQATLAELVETLKDAACPPPLQGVNSPDHMGLVSRWSTAVQVAQQTLTTALAGDDVEAIRSAQNVSRSIISGKVTTQS